MNLHLYGIFVPILYVLFQKRVFMNICEKSGLGTCNETQTILQKGFHLIDRNRLIWSIQFLNVLSFCFNCFSQFFHNSESSHIQLIGKKDFSRSNQILATLKQHLQTQSNYFTLIMLIICTKSDLNVD